MNVAVGFLALNAPLLMLSFLTFALSTHTHTHGRGCGQKQEGDQQEPYGQKDQLSSCGGVYVTLKKIHPEFIDLHLEL